MSWSALYRIGRFAAALLLALAAFTGPCDSDRCTGQDHPESTPHFCCSGPCHDAVPPDVPAPEPAAAESTTVTWQTAVALGESIVEGIDPPPVNRI